MRDVELFHTEGTQHLVRSVNKGERRDSTSFKDREKNIKKNQETKPGTEDRTKSIRRDK